MEKNKYNCIYLYFQVEISASYSSSEAEPLSLKAEQLWSASVAALPREITVWLLCVFTSF